MIEAAETVPYIRNRWWSNSDPHRTMSFTLSPEGDVRYPGDPIERTEALLKYIRENPTKVTLRSRLRKHQTKELRNWRMPRRRVSREELDLEYSSYAAGRVTFELMWETLSCYVSRRAEVEQNDFTFRERGKSGDVVNSFLMSIRPGLTSKAFTGDKGSTFHNYINRAWHLYKAGVFTKQKQEDDTLVSESESVVSEDGEDEVSVFDRWVNEETTRDDDSCTLDDLRQRVADAMVYLTDEERLVLTDLTKGVEQRDTALKLGKSRHQVARMQARIVKMLREKGSVQ